MLGCRERGAEFALGRGARGAARPCPLRVTPAARWLGLGERGGGKGEKLGREEKGGGGERKGEGGTEEGRGGEEESGESVGEVK